MAYRFILRPWITEKTQGLMSENKYVFKLRLKTTKSQVKSAVEKLYNVEVDKINIVNIPQKKRRFGRVIGKKSAIKKAIVTLKKGHKIEIFE
ncbi:MAG TPA: 50S ribosomal protein L23 [Candidatus Moranbacteria bacterium]|nr:50S ribosomal protein L23 [Candidatus Moranbacteria bacterium]